MHLLSICISAYEMGGYGPSFLENNLERLTTQTFKDFDVIISDQSKDSGIKNICEKYKGKLDIKYFRNENAGNSSDNINTGIKNATGKLIKILFLDDFLYKNTSLEEIVNNFDVENDGWLITACIVTNDGKNFFSPHTATYNDETILMKNSVGAPSVMTMKNIGDPVLFDEKLVWWQDLDYYKRCYKKFGQPKVLNEINVAIRVHPNQISNVIATETRREKEFHYILEKYNVKYAWLKKIKYKLRKYKRLLKSKIKKYVSH